MMDAVASRAMILVVLLASAKAFAPAVPLFGCDGWGCTVLSPPRCGMRPHAHAHRRARVPMMDSEKPVSHQKHAPGKLTKEERLRLQSHKVVCIGLSHKTASVEVRERLAVPEHEWQAVQRKIATLPDIKEAAIISTCNRHEIYFVTPVITFSSRNQRPIPYACSVQKNCADSVRAGLPQRDPACDRLSEHSAQRVKAGAAGKPIYADRG